MSRLGHTPCEIDVRGLDNVGKRKELNEIVFEMPSEYKFNLRKEIATELALKKCPVGWKTNCYFGSQGSFFRS